MPLDSASKIAAHLDRIDEVLPGLFLGGIPGVESCDALNVNRITHVLSLREGRMKRPRGCEILHLPMSDAGESALEPLVRKGSAFIDAALGSGGRVLVMCDLGVNRSPTLVAAYLMVKGWTLDEALEKVLKARPIVGIVAPYRVQLRELSVSIEMVPREVKSPSSLRRRGDRGDGGGAESETADNVALKRASAEQIIKQLIRAGVSGAFGSHATVHRKAYRAGAGLVEPLVDRIEAADWSRLGPREGMAAFTALWLLLHDLDEQASRSLADKLLGRRALHRVYVQRLTSITSFSLADYLEVEWAGVNVFIMRKLANVTGVADQVAGWLKAIPSEQLLGLDRLYVIDRAQDRNWGEYLRVLSNIVLVWRGWNQASRLRSELTLYHEIGHHVDPVSDAPKSEREAFADRFAFGRFAVAHPILGHRLIRGITGPLLLGSRWRSIADTL